MSRLPRALLAALLLAAPAALPAEGPVAALVIDDLGDRPGAAERLVALDVPVVCAFLPHTPHAAAQARRCHHAGLEVMLHLPMEAVDGSALGPGGVGLDMDRAAFRASVRRSLEAVPHAVAVNNHMGSLLTRHPGHMRWLMELLDEAGGLLFLDSRTTPLSVAEDKAEQAGLPALRRDVFLDHERDPEAIRSRLRELMRTAREDGAAVAIGHPYPETLDVLDADLAALAEHYGVKLIGLLELHDRMNGR